MFIEILNTLISESGISKNKILTDIGINHNAINDWTKKNQTPNGETLSKIADYFNVTTDFLLGRGEDVNKITAKKAKLNANAIYINLNLWDDFTAEDEIHLVKTANAVIDLFSNAFTEYDFNSINVLIHKAPEWDLTPRTTPRRITQNITKNFQIQLRLDAQAYLQVFYQLSHELCHLIMNAYPDINNLKWIPECICDVASLYFLEKVSEVADGNYVPFVKQSVDNYLSEIYQAVKKGQLQDTEKNLNGYFINNLSAFENDCIGEVIDRVRWRNTLVAKELLPLFRKNPSLWNSIVGMRNYVSSADFLKEWQRETKYKDLPLAFIDLFGLSDVNIVQPEPQLIRFIRLPEIDLPVSAGPGIYITGEDVEYVDTLFDEVPDSANCIMRVRGDSMEPNFSDGDRVFVHFTEFVEPGEIGIFDYEGERYIKVAGDGELISLNPESENIKITNPESLFSRGVVLGKVSEV
ncbi:MAG: XRE family transcriptional regulator [Oscillospiraceae bacterium]|jgi:transcriptional regulator with XRE-family HTH domain|nr:XRE family transcriptional regulator [Oscillospiraceae bacterium]